MDASVRFSVLGPVEVRVGVVRPDLGGLRQQRLLAALLLEADRPVAPVDLIAAVWQQPPPTGSQQLSTCVWRLRKVLDRHGAAGLLRREATGYRLHITDPAMLDLRAFEGDARQGRMFAGSGRPVEAVRRLRAAMAQWRGTPLLGLAGEPFDAERARIEQSRLDTVEVCAEQQLRCGILDGLVEELTGLLAEHPLRERLAASLMAALYRTGRAAEALAVYRDLAAALRDELGIEPGGALQALHTAMLRRDPLLDRVTTPAPGRVIRRTIRLRRPRL